MRMMQEAAGGGSGGQGGPQVVRLTEEEGASVQRLAELCGVDRNMAAQAYLACEKSEEMAANFLLEDSMGFKAPEEEAHAPVMGSGRGDTSAPRPTTCTRYFMVSSQRD